MCSPKKIPNLSFDILQLWPAPHFASFLLRPSPDAFSPMNNGLAVVPPKGAFEIGSVLILLVRKWKLATSVAKNLMIQWHMMKIFMEEPMREGPDLANKSGPR